ncbi:MAG: SDR family NAD(P)-dependent oxidoreductase, partial [Betaproteobacteria bacterium]|nr:SDR family NAD(P)-dependent oxidoreductase [Betaproteobacteria bacterium]
MCRRTRRRSSSPCRARSGPSMWSAPTTCRQCCAQWTTHIRNKPAREKPLDLELRGSTALITGGSRGIGAGTARVLAAEGVDLVLVGRDEEALAQTRADIVSRSNVKVDTMRTDVSSGEEVIRLAALYGPRVSILINNAGAVPSGDLFAVSEARWREGWDSKVFAYVNMCRAFYPHLRARGGGVVV